jgi:hypothetical protein
VNPTSSLPQLDPSNLNDFGSIPTSYVLFHLLRYTATEVERRLTINVKANVLPSIVAGGVGSSLFALEHQNSDVENSTVTMPLVAKKPDVTLQLLVASTLVMIEYRSDAIENLRKAITREQRMSHEGTFDADDDNDAACDDESTGVPLSSSGEEDDPALTLAMNYVEDDVPLSSESLENKGMMRKAAAAAHEATAMIQSLRKRTDCWKNEVSIISGCVLCSLKILRQFLQSMVRRQFFLNEQSSTEEQTGFSLLDAHAYLPLSVNSKLAQELASLMSVATQSSFLAMIGGDEIETERLFRSLSIYKESVCVWSECIPLFYPSASARLGLLTSSVAGCSDFAMSFQSPACMENVSAFPSSDLETQFYKLNVLCRRLRVGDVLDGFVSRPFHFVAAMESCESNVQMSPLNVVKRAEDPCTASSLISSLGSALESLCGVRSELEGFYLALCNRCQARTLLLDGFFAATETESDNRPVLSATVKTLSTGDTVRVATSPSPALQFDVTKCADSIAVFSGFGDESRGEATTGVSSVHQRASKVWGTVVSTQQYSPKTGVHRWAIRLDKCERGHVFIGVATAQATMKTYVGGDKYGWGMIGTQALWHDRRKVSNAYDGSSFRTRCRLSTLFLFLSAFVFY